ncbi:DUF5723 family protein, partial [Arthrospira platensis SPKY1]|nr:DUF5723 family protein [Arthrospira platensis SPKY1]
HFMHPAADPDDFFRTLKKRNDLFFETHISLLSAGINIKDWYFTVGVTEKFDFRFSFSSDFLKALYHLNGHPDYLGGTIDLSGTSINSSYYREYAIGASKDINKK